MLMLMTPENNSDLNQNGATNTGEPTNPVSGLNPSTPESSPNVTIPSSQTSFNPTPPNSPIVSHDTNTPTVQPVMGNSNTNKPPKAKKSSLKYILAVLIVIILLAGVAAAAYHEGKSKRVIVHVAATTTNKPISLPPTAIVSESCVPGRGKQYVIPKDIPQGPIYDVENSKVIAIEYLINIQELLTNTSTFSSSFSNIILSLSRNYPVDHFAMVPAAPPAGQTGEFINLIMFVVSAKEANAITCAGTSSTTGSSTTSKTTTTGSSTTTSTTTPTTTTTTTTGSSTTSKSPTTTKAK